MWELAFIATGSVIGVCIADFVKWLCNRNAKVNIPSASNNSAMLKLLYDIKFYLNDPHHTINEGVDIDNRIDAVVAQLQQ